MNALKPNFSGNYKTIFFILLFSIMICQNSNVLFSKKVYISDDSLKTQVELKIADLKNAVTEMNHLIELPTPKNVSSDELQNWYKQTSWLLGTRNVNEEYLINFRKMLDEWNYLSHQPVEGDFIQMKMEFKSALFDYINEGKKFITLTKDAEERMENAFIIINSLD